MQSDQNAEYSADFPLVFCALSRYFGIWGHHLPIPFNELTHPRFGRFALRDAPCTLSSQGVLPCSPSSIQQLVVTAFHAAVSSAMPPAHPLLPACPSLPKRTSPTPRALTFPIPTRASTSTPTRI